jgi:hypothetical protein
MHAVLHSLIERQKTLCRSGVPLFFELPVRPVDDVPAVETVLRPERLACSILQGIVCDHRLFRQGKGERKRRGIFPALRVLTQTRLRSCCR